MKTEADINTFADFIDAIRENKPKICVGKWAIGSALCPKSYLAKICMLNTFDDYLPMEYNNLANKIIEIKWPHERDILRISNTVDNWAFSKFSSSVAVFGHILTDIERDELCDHLETIYQWVIKLHNEGQAARELYKEDKSIDRIR